ncbi:MAG: hypothetical protein JJU02_03415 [Cryomorphaceae bacterium]|nr:hypothetical protein [Cryomorphaceae bacterium]
MLSFQTILAHKNEIYANDLIRHWEYSERINSENETNFFNDFQMSVGFLFNHRNRNFQGVYTNFQHGSMNIDQSLESRSYQFVNLLAQVGILYKNTFEVCFSSNLRTNKLPDKSQAFIGVDEFSVLYHYYRPEKSNFSYTGGLFYGNEILDLPLGRHGSNERNVFYTSQMSFLGPEFRIAYNYQLKNLRFQVGLTYQIGFAVDQQSSPYLSYPDDLYGYRQEMSRQSYSDLAFSHNDYRFGSTLHALQIGLRVILANNINDKKTN